MAGPVVIGRDEQLAAIEAFLAAAQDGPAALVLSGEPGIGKTVLWERGVAAAAEGFSRVLTCRGAEAEASLSFAGLSDLLGDVLDETLPELALPRRRALEIALLLTEPGDDAPDHHAIGLALLDVLRTLMRTGPVLVALDDAQWLDVASAGALQLALRRLRAEPLGMLATLRIAPDLVAAFGLDRSFSEERRWRLSLGPLSMGALHGLLKERLELDLSRPELARVSEATAGNPYFALELGRELVRTSTRPLPGRALRVPETLRELLGGRLARLPAETTDVLLLVAALARPSVELVSAAHGDEERAVAAVEAARLEGVLDSDDARVRFVHPLLASICYEQAPAWKRRAVHGALAGIVSDVEERARHRALAAAGPDPAVAADLDLAAEQAAGRGATATAAELAELAAEMTPDDGAQARQRRLRAANFHRVAGDLNRAAAILEGLLSEVPRGVERADVLFALAWTVRSGHATIIRFCEEALAEAQGDDERLARILAWRAWANALLGGDIRGALVDARAALEKAERVGDPALLTATIAQLGAAETWSGEFTPGLLERGVELEQGLERPLEFHQSPRATLARRLQRQGELDRARGILEGLEAEASTRGDEYTLWLVSNTLSRLEWWAGNLRRALDHANLAYEFARQIEGEVGLAHAAHTKALVELDLGLVDQARMTAAEGLASSEGMSNAFFTALNLGVLGRLELAVGNAEAAAGYLRELPERLLALGLKDPAQPIWPDAIETLIALGELEDARTCLEQHELNAQRFGSPLAVAGAARCRGLLAAAEGDFDAASASFARALAELGGLDLPIERGRTLLSLGSMLRRAQQKRAAREALREALAIFERLGAPLWAERARVELRRISGRPPASEELTETEERVAALAAQGRSNKEIAAELFMGVSTVEMHLSRVYRKLGVRRAELGGRLMLRGEPAET